jgi:hypothetical protein
MHWLNEKLSDIRDSIEDLTNTIQQSIGCDSNVNASANGVVSHADGNGGPFIFDDDETNIEQKLNSLKTFVRKVMGGEKVKQL